MALHLPHYDCPLLLLFYLAKKAAHGRTALAGLAALGAGAASDVRLQLHSVLAGGKRRLTAELGHTAGAACLQLQRVSCSVPLCVGVGVGVLGRKVGVRLMEMAQHWQSMLCQTGTFSYLAWLGGACSYITCIGPWQRRACSDTAVLLLQDAGLAARSSLAVRRLLACCGMGGVLIADSLIGVCLPRHHQCLPRHHPAACCCFVLLLRYFLQLLYRVQAKSWLQLMIAPLGGSLDVFGRSVTPVRGG